jgi:phage terminase large subunit-like protein
MRKRGKFLPIVELEHKQQQKEIRIRGLIPRYASGSIFHIECKDLDEELITFPRGLNDDIADACAYQLQVSEQMGGKEPVNWRALNNVFNDPNV